MMERRKFTTTLSIEALRQLHLIAAMNDISNLNYVIEYLAKSYINDNNLGGMIGAIEEDGE
jgi:hypothetical protein